MMPDLHLIFFPTYQIAVSTRVFDWLLSVDYIDLNGHVKRKQK